MPDASGSTTPALRATRFILLAAIVSTFAMLMVPPFVTVVGTQHAPAWTALGLSSPADPLTRDLGLGARIDWSTLLFRLVAFWIVALIAWGVADAVAARRVE